MLVFVSIMCIELEKIKVISFKFQIITVYNLLWLSVHLDIGLSLSFVQSADKSGTQEPSRAVIFLKHNHADQLLTRLSCDGWAHLRKLYALNMSIVCFIDGL